MRKLYVCEGEIVWSQVKLIENTDRLNSNRGSIRFKIDTIRAGAECSRGGESINYVVTLGNVALIASTERNIQMPLENFIVMQWPKFSVNERQSLAWAKRRDRERELREVSSNASIADRHTLFHWGLGWAVSSVWIQVSTLFFTFASVCVACCLVVYAPSLSL